MSRNPRDGAAQRALKAAGLCVHCGKPHTRGTWHCELCGERKRKQKARLYHARKGERRTYRCSLCLGAGHSYRTCKLNADVRAATEGAR